MENLLPTEACLLRSKVKDCSSVHKIYSRGSVVFDQWHEKQETNDKERGRRPNQLKRKSGRNSKKTAYILEEIFNWWHEQVLIWVSFIYYNCVITRLFRETFSSLVHVFSCPLPLASKSCRLSDKWKSTRHMCHQGSTCLTESFKDWKYNGSKLLLNVVYYGIPADLI